MYVEWRNESAEGWSFHTAFHVFRFVFALCSLMVGWLGGSEKAACTRKMEVQAAFVRFARSFTA